MTQDRQPQFAEGPDEALEKTLKNNLREETHRKTNGLSDTKQCFHFTVKDNAENIAAGVTAETKGLWLYIQYLWVSEGLRGQGLGRMLLEKAMEEGYKRGCRKAYLETYSWEAPDFYKKLGFEISDKLEGIYGQYDFFYFQRPIKPKEE